MARRCLCARLLAAVETDPRLRTLPLAARMLFLLVAEAAARSPVPGLLPFRETARVSLLVSASETETETQLETLRREGLIRDEGQGIGVPLLLDVPARADAARRNGAAGGRPRKGESAEAARERRQREMLLPLPAAPGAAAPGAAGKPTETQAGKPAPIIISTISTATASEEGEGSAREAPAWVSLGAELAALAGLDPARGGYDFRPVQGWLAAGHAPDAIRAAVQRVAAQPGYAASRVWTLKFFDQAVQRERFIPAAPAAMSAAERAAEAAALDAIERRVAEAIRTGGRRPA
jgi:hypothetical protein